jgi:hypothetical protein
MGLASVALGLACGVDGREALVGRYEAAIDGRREQWSLAADGTCEIVREVAAAAAETTRCEWEYVDREGRRALIVTVLGSDGPGAASPHRTRYVLTPTRLPWEPVTIPLGPRPGWQLRKVQ